MLPHNLTCLSVSIFFILVVWFIGAIVEAWFRGEFEGNHIMGATNINGEVHVSTIFLAVDHQTGGGPPVLFETMIFGGPHDGYQERYSTWGEAEAGHQRAILLARTLS